MADAQEQQLIGRFAAILASLHPVEPRLARLCEAARQMLGADGAVLRLSVSGLTAVVASTDQLSSELEDLQEVIGEGPSKDALRDNAVLVADLSSDDDPRWSVMRDHGRRLGFRGHLVAVPLAADHETIGTLTAHGSSTRLALDPMVTGFLSAAISTAVLQDPQFEHIEDRFAEEWPSQTRIHQATGMIMSQVGIRPEDALALLRGQAFANDLSLADVAQQIIERRINFRNFTIEGD